MKDTTSVGSVLQMNHQEKICPKHGKYMAFRIFQDGEPTPWSTCPRCQEGLPALTKEDIEATRIYEMRCALEEAGVPWKHLSSMFENFLILNESHLNALQGCKDMTSGDYKSLLLYGPTGRGKTHLAVSTLRVFVEQRKSVLYTTETALIGSLLQAMDGHSGGDRKALLKLSLYDLLVVDEIGNKKMSEYFVQSMFDLIDARWNAGKATIYLGNVTASEFKEHFTDPMRSRIKDHGNYFKLDGEDFRLQKR
jgi:DNA replication protein DnaC